MEKVIEILNRMQADGVIEKFAIGGGIAAIYYLEPYQQTLSMSSSRLYWLARAVWYRSSQYIPIWRTWVTCQLKKVC